MFNEIETRRGHRLWKRNERHGGAHASGSQSLDIIEIERAVIKASPYFDCINLNSLGDPGRM